MTLLIKNDVGNSSTNHANGRVKTAGTKLNREELAALEAHCRAVDTTPGELIRRLILAEISNAGKAEQADPLLCEIVGIRLLLVNLLKPRDDGQGPLSTKEYKAILEGVRKVKRQVANDIKRECAEGTTR